MTAADHPPERFDATAMDSALLALHSASCVDEDELDDGRPAPPPAAATAPRHHGAALLAAFDERERADADAAAAAAAADGGESARAVAAAATARHGGALPPSTTTTATAPPPPPGQPCLPWDHNAFAARLRTFTPATWFAKPDALSPLACVRARAARPSVARVPTAESFFTRRARIGDSRSSSFRSRVRSAARS